MEVPVATPEIPLYAVGGSPLCTNRKVAPPAGDSECKCLWLFSTVDDVQIKMQDTRCAM
jgi:hypothetical protein